MHEKIITNDRQISLKCKMLHFSISIFIDTVGLYFHIPVQLLACRNIRLLGRIRLFSVKRPIIAQARIAVDTGKHGVFKRYIINMFKRLWNPAKHNS